MKVLLVSLNRVRGRETFPHPCFPLGVAYLGAYLREIGHEVKILDLCFVDDTRKTIKGTIEQFEPEIIGVSMRNTLNYYHFLVPSMNIDIDYCKRYSEASIVIGGGAFSMYAEEILRACNLKYGIIGEGEYAFADLIEILGRARERGDCAGRGECTEVRDESINGIDNISNIAKIPGIALLHNDNFYSNPPDRIKNLDSLPFPARDLFNDLDKYKIANIQTTRGLPPYAVHRASPIIAGATVRYRTPSKVVDELEIMLNEFGLNQIYLVDEICNENPKHLKKVCEEIIARDIEVGLEGHIQPNLLPKSLLEVMVKAGFKLLDLIVDSGSQEMLKKMNSSDTLDTYVKCFEMCERAGVIYSCYTFLGGPGETYSTAEQTLRFLETHDPPIVLMLEALPLHPGSPLVDLAIRDNVIREHQNLLYPSWYLSPELSEVKDKYYTLIKKYTERHPNWGYEPSYTISIPDDPNEIPIAEQHKGLLPWDDRTYAVFRNALDMVPGLIREFVKKPVMITAESSAKAQGRDRVINDDLRNAISSIAPKLYRTELLHSLYSEQ